MMDPHSEITKNELYERFTTFCKARGLQIDPKQTIGRKLIKDHKWIVARQLKVDRHYVWKYVRFRTEEEMLEDPTISNR
jgi:hypothetical protein